MNELKFNSQICTTKEQSLHLLELGLKPETADCFHWEYDRMWYIGSIDDEGLTEKDVPAWSLHRLIELLPKVIHINSTQWYLSITPYYNNMVAYEHCGRYEVHYLYKGSYDDIYHNIIKCIEKLIEVEYFNKEYLK